MKLDKTRERFDKDIIFCCQSQLGFQTRHMNSKYLKSKLMSKNICQ